MGSSDANHAFSHGAVSQSRNGKRDPGDNAKIPNQQARFKPKKHLIRQSGLQHNTDRAHGKEQIPIARFSVDQVASTAVTTHWPFQSKFPEDPEHCRWKKRSHSLLRSKLKFGKGSLFQ